MIQEQLIFSSFCKILGWSIHNQLFAKFIVCDILADTALPGNASKKEPLCSCSEHISRARLQLCTCSLITLAHSQENCMCWGNTCWMGWLLKKKALSVMRICQHASILEGQSWALDCFCHCDVLSIINWPLSSTVDYRPCTSWSVPGIKMSS